MAGAAEGARRRLTGKSSGACPGSRSRAIGGRREGRRSFEVDPCCAVRRGQRRGGRRRAPSRGRALLSHAARGRAVGTKPKLDRKSTRLNSSHVKISYAVFCLKKKKKG